MGHALRLTKEQLSALTGKSARSKFGAVRTEVDGRIFASRKEAARYAELKLMEKAGVIADLKLQPRIDCNVVGYGKVCTYVADFCYWKRGNFKVSENQVGGEAGKFIYEDVKGFKTPIYKLKKKLVKALTGIDIIEI